MRITVLGKSPSWPDAGGACSGYLIQSGDYALLLDCGTGVFGALRAVMPYRVIDAVLITHMHSDHFFDLVPFSYALTLGSGAAGTAPPALHVPPGAAAILEAMVGSWSDDAKLVAGAFALTEYDPERELALGPLTAHLREVPHYTAAHAVRISDGAASLTFSADCGPNETLVELARDTDLLLVEATLGESEGAAGSRGHLTAWEAGDIGRRAGAHRVLLTHFSDELDRDRIGAQARSGFGDDVMLAIAGDEYSV